MSITKQIIVSGFVLSLSILFSASVYFYFAYTASGLDAEFCATERVQIEGNAARRLSLTGKRPTRRFHISPCHFKVASIQERLGWYFGGLGLLLGVLSGIWTTYVFLTSPEISASSKIFGSFSGIIFGFVQFLNADLFIGAWIVGLGCLCSFVAAYFLLIA